MVVAVALLFFLPDLCWQVTLVHYGQPSAVIWKDQVIVATNGPQPSYDSGLYRGQFLPYRKNVQAPGIYGNPSHGKSFQAKVGIRDQRILLFATGANPRILPLLDLQLLEESEFGKELLTLRGYPNYSFLVNGSACSSARTLLFPPHRKPDVPLPLRPVAREGARSPEQTKWQREMWYLESVRFDVQLAGPKTLRLFHADGAKLFVSIEPDYLEHWQRDPKTFEWDGNLLAPPARELRTGKLPADFTEHFAAYTADKRDYLVTANGKVYTAVPKGKTEIEVTKVWDDPKQGIAGVVQDQENDAVYGWGIVTDLSKPERFYVKLSSKPVAVAYKRTVPLWGDRSDGYLESYECARAFRAANEKK